MTGWIRVSALILAPLLASCDREPSEAKRVEAEAPAEPSPTASAGTRAGALFSNAETGESKTSGLAAGLGDLLGSASTPTSSTAVAAVVGTAPGSTAVEDRAPSDTIGAKETAAEVVADPDPTPTAEVAGASASSRTEKPASVGPLAPSASPAPSPSGPLALGGSDPLRVGDRVLAQVASGKWVAAKIVRVRIDGTYDVEHDKVIERGLDPAKLHGTAK